MLRLENVSKTYSRGDETVVALQPTCLEIGAGEFVAVVGQSGSGKTTLLSMLGGMLAPSEGRIYVDGQSLYDMSAAERARIRRKTIGFVFQAFNLVPYLSALENVQMPLMLSGFDTAAQCRVATDLLGRVGLESRLHHKPSELSHGQQQRVALARTLANDPTVILADEPTGNLDPGSRHQILGLLEGFHDEGRTVVMVTHDPVAAARASRSFTLSEGIVQTAIISDPGKAA